MCVGGVGIGVLAKRTKTSGIVQNVEQIFIFGLLRESVNL